MKLKVASAQPSDDSDGARPDKPAISITALHKSFKRKGGEVVTPVDGISFDVVAGEFVVLLGPSGCGKTTLLRCVAGLEQPDAGRIELNGQAVYDDEERVDVPPEKRPTTVVFQSYALWPHLTVFKNVAYPLRRSGLDREEVRARVALVLDMVGINRLGDQYPSQLSGGQQQRVALARALATNRDVVLFDEPLSNVDAKVRDQLRLDLLSMQRDLGFASLYVTHDQQEAMELAHRVAVLRNGRIEHLGPPQQVYWRPVTPYVAEFIGRANCLTGTVTGASGQRATVDTAVGTVRGEPSGPAVVVGAQARVVIRPEAVVLHDCVDDLGEAHPGIVQTVVFSGAQVRIQVELRGATVEVLASSRGDQPKIGDKVSVSWPEDACWILPLEETASRDRENGPVAASSEMGS